MAEKDYYNILGVSKTATDDEIKSAFRKKAKEFHPDINKSADAEAKFKEVNEAYAVLSDKQKRTNYDKFGTAEPGANFGGGAGGGTGFGGFGGFGNGAGGFDFNFGGFNGFEDLFSMFGGGSQTRKSNNAGEDINIRINLSFQEAVFGAKKRVSITRVKPCPTCNGTGAKNKEDVQTCPYCKGTGQIRQTQNTLFGRMSSVGPCPNCNGTGKTVKNPCSACGGKRCY